MMASKRHILFENLTCLTYHVTGGFAGIDEKLTISPGNISLTRREQLKAAKASFSDHEMQRLTEVLTQSDFARFTGTYRQQHLIDGFNETLIVTVGEGKDQIKYRIANCGTLAPAGYYKVTAYLRKLQEAKFAVK